MKKIILGLFLILGAMSFAAPKYVNTDKITQLGYKVDNDIPEIFLFQKMEPDGTGVSISLFEIPNKSSKYISDMEKENTPSEAQFIGSVQNNRAYVNKFANNENGGFTYNFVPKTEKIKNCYISVLYVTDSELSSTELNNAVDKILNEVESYLK